MNKFLITILSILTFSQLFLSNPTSKAEFNAFDIITDNHISFYEEFIAEEQIVSNKSKTELKKLAINNNISIDNIKKILILQHALKTIDKQYTIEQLSNKSSSEIVALIKDYYDHMNKKLSPKEKSKLKSDFKAYKKKSKQT